MSPKFRRLILGTAAAAAISLGTVPLATQDVVEIRLRGRFYSDDSSREYDVLDYNIDTFIDPRREYLEGRARLAVRIRSTAVSTLLLRLADTLVVTGVTSVLLYGSIVALARAGAPRIWSISRFSSSMRSLIAAARFS